MYATTCIGLIGLVTLLQLVAASPAKAAEQDPLNRNYNDHIAYVASFMLPTLTPRCEAAFPGYTARTAPVFLRWFGQQPRADRTRAVVDDVGDEGRPILAGLQAGIDR